MRWMRLTRARFSGYGAPPPGSVGPYSAVYNGEAGGYGASAAVPMEQEYGRGGQTWRAALGHDDAAGAPQGYAVADPRHGAGAYENSGYGDMGWGMEAAPLRARWPHPGYGGGWTSGTFVGLPLPSPGPPAPGHSTSHWMSPHTCACGGV